MINQEKELHPKLIIGTAGHRDIRPGEGVISVIDDSLVRLMEIFPDRDIVVLSPLAEGADRMIYKRMRTLRTDTMLHAILPLEVNDYIRDFETPASIDEFLEMLEGSERIDIVMTRISTMKGSPLDDSQEDRRYLREVSYEACGHMMVDLCDVLVAIWDGEKARGKGGTGEVVDHARSKEVPLVWINSNDPFRVIYERLDEK